MWDVASGRHSDTGCGPKMFRALPPLVPRSRASGDGPTVLADAIGALNESTPMSIAAIAPRRLCRIECPPARNDALGGPAQSMGAETTPEPVGPAAVSGSVIEPLMVRSLDRLENDREQLIVGL